MEGHLHRSQHGMLVQYLKDIDIQVIMTTHSPEVLAAVDNDSIRHLSPEGVYVGDKETALKDLQCQDPLGFLKYINENTLKTTFVVENQFDEIFLEVLLKVLYPKATILSQFMFQHNSSRVTFHQALNRQKSLQSIVYPNQKKKNPKVKVFVMVDQDINSLEYLEKEEREWKDPNITRWITETRSLEGYLFHNLDSLFPEIYKCFTHTDMLMLHTDLRKVLAERVAPKINVNVSKEDIDAEIKRLNGDVEITQELRKTIGGTIAESLRKKIIADNSGATIDSWLIAHNIPHTLPMQGECDYGDLLLFADGHKIVKHILTHTIPKLDLTKREGLSEHLSLMKDKNSLPQGLIDLAKRVKEFVTST
eukprot:gene11563-13496_t